MSTNAVFPIHVEAIRWRDNAPEILDQTRLPAAEVWLRLESADAVAEAIRALRVRGAPAIGVAAAMGVAVEAQAAAGLPMAELRARLERAEAVLAATRPTAVNLGWALARMRRCWEALDDRPSAEVAAALVEEALRILEEDREMCRRIGEHGLPLIPAGSARIMTHCNAGALATAGMGTALAPIYLAHRAGYRLRVFAGETRPLLQGSRLTAWELRSAGIDVTLVTDSMAGYVMSREGVDLVIVGADRIAANGDVANKIGTYGLAVLAAHHSIPFYVAAPVSTIDPACPDGASIPIEMRGAEEVRRGFGARTAPEDVAVLTPAFDVTPASLITAIITDRGVLRPQYTESIRGLGLDVGW